VISFVLWAQKCFDGCAFAICGKSIQSVNRNITYPLLPKLISWGFRINFKESKNFFEVTGNRSKNRFYLFGGKDESSAGFIQGVTLAGAMFDEVTLLVRSFVDQCLARCSVENSRFWFTCNPQSPDHWFFKEWIKKGQEKGAFYLHFGMNDNPGLSEEIKARYDAIYSGVFHDRYIKGLWVAPDGLVYPFFDPKVHVVNTLPESFEQFYLSCDYGIVNPSSFGLWGRSRGVWYRIREYYHDIKKEKTMRTDAEHYEKLVQLAGDNRIEAVVVDPSAASFIECIKRGNRFRVVKAENEVLPGISRVSRALKAGTLLISAQCKDSIQEFGFYKWDQSTGKDKPQKQNDHAMDEIRYFVSTIIFKPCTSPYASCCVVERAGNQKVF
jgi:PBSX family phage terminase large subunit